MTNVTKEFQEYFEGIANSVEGVVHVAMSGGNQLERMLEGSRSKTMYPGVFCLRPRYKIEDNGADNIMAWFDVVFYVFCRGKAGDYEAEDAAFDGAEHIAEAIYTRLRQDDTEYCLLDRTAYMMEPVQSMTVDAVFGYEVKVRFGLGINAVLYANT